MVTRLTPACIWMQLGNASFLCSGLFGDLLIIRLFLSLAYVWLLTAAAVGYPSWPGVDNPGFYSLDGILWAIANLFFHGTALFQLIWDERSIRLKSEEEQQLWKFFYRRSGMGKLEFKESFKLARLSRFKAGEIILDGQASQRTLMLLVEGLAAYRVTATQAPKAGGSLQDTAGHPVAPALSQKGALLQEDTLLRSGHTFDIGLLNVLGVFIGFELAATEVKTVTASTDCVVVFWDLEDLNTLATCRSPALSAFWRNFALCQVGLEWFQRQKPHLPAVNGRGQPEPASVLDGTHRSSDFTDPLEPYENPSPSLLGVLRWLPTTFAPFLPPGMRHTTMPRAGALARNRLMALAAAQGSAQPVWEAEPAELRASSRRILNSLSGQVHSLAGNKEPV